MHCSETETLYGDIRDMFLLACIALKQKRFMAITRDMFLRADALL
jgi:hypothetical protein